MDRRAGFLILLFLVVFVDVSSGKRRRKKNKGDNINSEDYLIGGLNADKDLMYQYKSAAWIEYKGKYRCMATWFNHHNGDYRFLVTVKYCLDNVDLSKVYVYLGSWNRTSNDYCDKVQVAAKVDTVPGLTVLRLATAPSCTLNTLLRCPYWGKNVNKWTTGNVLGWGSNVTGPGSVNSDNFPNVLKVVSVKIYKSAPNKCKVSDNGVMVSPNVYQTCAKSFSKTRYTGLCYGDGGGPILDWGGDYNIIGIGDRSSTYCEGKQMWSIYFNMQADVCSFIAGAITSLGG